MKQRKHQLDAPLSSSSVVEAKISDFALVSVAATSDDDPSMMGRRASNNNNANCWLWNFKQKCNLGW